MISFREEVDKESGMEDNLGVEYCSIYISAIRFLNAYCSPTGLQTRV